MVNNKASDIAIGSDAPQADPVHDAFGYAPFAQRIAKTVCTTPSPQGLVMSINGTWGAGKSTLLNFIKHYIACFPKSEQPIVINFNPWWFNSREHLATQFLNLFRTKLLNESKVLSVIGDKMADYGTAIGTMIAYSYGIPWLDIPIGFILKLFKKKLKDVPILKNEIAKALREAGQRFVFVIDDIDRLAPDEICELFKVIKALADFPNVIYLLAFDRKMVAEALRSSLGVEGDAYIEKIVQAPFSLPAIDPLRLRKKFFVELEKVLELSPQNHIDQIYWGNVYFDGLDHYIKKPRDIVRIVNSLGVLYPGLVGEVNPVDFIALGFLRVFEPEVYSLIYYNKDKFVDYLMRSYRQDLNSERDFHNGWLEKIPLDRRDNVKRLVLRLFPQLESVLGNMSYGSDFAITWRKELRVCSSDIFDIYFQFEVLHDVLSRAELDELVVGATQFERAVEILIKASMIKRPDGTSKACEYLERLRDLEDKISPESASGLLLALFEIGDKLLSIEDEQGGMLAIPNRCRLMSTINHLLARIPPNQYSTLMLEKIVGRKAIGLIVQTIADIEECLSKPNDSQNKPLAQINGETAGELRTILVDRLSRLESQELLAITDLAYVVHHWIRWAGRDVVIIRLDPILNSDSHLPLFLEKYLRFGIRQGMSDRVAKRVPQLNPKDLESITDIFALKLGVEKMLNRYDLTTNQRIAGEQFIKGMERIQQGREPIGLFPDD